jgi:RimJ/RimL family protein N-acetyltransferase
VLVNTERAPVRPPDPPLADDRVSLRLFEAADAEPILRACQDPDIARWTTIPQPYQLEDAQSFIEETQQAWVDGRDPTFVVVERASGELVGAIGLRRERPDVWEVGYWIAAGARGRGIATAALRLISRWAIDELGAQRIGLLVYVGNDASARVAEKAGYRREGILRRYALQRGELRDAIIHSRLPEDGR